MANLDLSKYGISGDIEVLHNPTYDFNDQLIPKGAAFWVRLAERFLVAA